MAIERTGRSRPADAAVPGPLAIDTNGDGFDDFIDLTGLAARPAVGFVIQGDVAGDRAGYSVSSAGDINGDGFDDFIVGAPLGDDGGNQAGEAYVIFGRASPFGTIDLTNLGSAGFVIQGDFDNDYAGYGVASAGDVNGDGFDDIIVGAFRGDDGGSVNAGKAYVIFGKASGFGTIDLANIGSAGFAIQGDANYDTAGFSVASAGDVNGDGFDDVIVGAPRGDDGGFNAGEAYVIFGKASGFGTIDLTSLGSAGFIIQGDADLDYAGWSVASAGDINGDGFDDVIVGARYGDDAGSTNAGQAYVIFGKASGFGTVDITSLGGAGFIIQGDMDSDRLGISVASAGDFNGDGFDDLIVGAPYASYGSNVDGQAYVIFGKASGFGTIDVGSLGTAGFIIRGDTDFDNAGRSVSSAGDVNGDGFDDLIVGAPFGSNGGSFAGGAYLIFGKASGFGTIDLSTFDPTNPAFDPAAGLFIQGDVSGDRAGTSVAGAGDINNDGFDDLIVGAPYGNDGGAQAGEAYVILGHAPTVAVTRIGSLAGQTIRGGAFNDTLDGREGADLLFGADGSDILIGGSGNDLLIGGTGNDTMSGGLGNDTFYVDAAGDVVNESASEGTDRVATSVTYALMAGAEVEQLEAVNTADTSAMDLTGNDFVNQIIGNAGVNLLFGLGGNDQLIGLNGNDFLVGGVGADLMYGGTGNDTFYVDDIGDRAYELVGEGTDRIATTITYTLDDSSEVELLEAVNTLDTNAMDLTGSNSANRIIGNAGTNLLYGLGGNDQLVGLAGDDSLIGGTGADLMYGGTGNDAYYVDDIGDRAYENAGEGTDRISTVISYALDDSSEIELLESTNILDTNAMDLAGSSSANTIIGNAGVNILYGGGGNDTLVALGGNDFLIGGTGADLMGGGLGDDTFYVDDIGDQINEFASQGNDRVATSVSYTLTHDLETLEAVNTADTSAINLTGNAAANTIAGNAGANLIDGKGAADLLIGYGGADTFAFTTALGGGNVDHIFDFVSGTDKIALDDAIFGALGAGAFAFGTAAQDADDRIVYDSATGNLYFDADGNGAGAQMLFATLDNHAVLVASDFTVI